MHVNRKWWTTIKHGVLISTFSVNFFFFFLSESGRKSKDYSGSSNGRFFERIREGTLDFLEGTRQKI